MARVIPKNYARLRLNRQEEDFVLTLHQSYDEATVVIVKINSFPYEGNEMLMGIIFKTKGVVFIKTLEIDDFSEIAGDTRFYYDMLLKPLQKRIMGKLAAHRQLQVLANNAAYLKFPVKLMLYLPRIKRSQAAEIGEDHPINGHFIFNDDIVEIKKNPGGFESRCLSGAETANPDFSELSEDDLHAIYFQTCPEYVIPRHICPEITPATIKAINKTYEIGPVVLEGNENFVRIWQLDDEQVDLVNSLQEKHQLILACAGSGKSVLLLARAIKFAKNYPKKKILITFFNKALRSFYKWRLDVAGINQKNVICKNFHQLCGDLLKNNFIDLPEQQHDKNRYFEDLVTRVKEGLADGEIEERFSAVFIDEIQDFDLEWYRICFDLLEDKKENYILCLCGDPTQDIQGKIKRGIAPWQGENLPSYRGRSIRLTKNYRNCVEINKCASNFSDRCLAWAFDLGEKMTLHDEDFLAGEAARSVGRQPIIHMEDRRTEATAVTKAILRLESQLNVPLADIAVLYPCRFFTPANYYIEKWITDMLQENKIKFSFVKSTEDHPTFWKYASRRGVTLSNMGAIKGLDFSAVIVCGLLPFRYFNDDVDRIFINMKQVYTALTRAMDYLEVVVTNKPESDIITKFLIESFLSKK